MEQFAEVAPNAMPAFAVFQLNANSNNPEIHGKGITAAQNRVHIGFTGQGADCQPVTNEPQTNAYFMDIAGLSSLYLYNDNPHQPMQAVHYDTQVGGTNSNLIALLDSLHRVLCSSPVFFSTMNPKGNPGS